MKINKNRMFDFILIALCLISCIGPSYMTKVSFFNTLFAIIKIFCTIILLLKKNLKINTNDIVVLLFITIYSIANIYNGLGIVAVIERYLSWIVITFLIEVYMEKDYKVFIGYTSTILSCLVIINFISILMNPVNYYNNLTRVHFLGFDNDNVPVLLLAVYFNIFNIMLNKKEKLAYLSIITATISSILVWSANGIIGISMVMLYLLIIRKIWKKGSKVLNLKIYYSIALLFFVLVVLLRVQDHLSFLIQDILNRDLTFTGRTYIWDYAIESISNNKIFGIGIYDFALRLSRTGVYHAHCTLLNITFEAGILGLISYFSIWILSVVKSEKYKSNKYIYLTSYFIFIFLIITLVEFYVKDIMFITLIGMIYNLSKLIKRGELYNEESRNINIS